MAATPYTGTVTFRGASGQTYQHAISGTDVVNAFLTYAKTGVTQWAPPEPVQLVDIVVSGSAGDTTRLDLFVGNADANISFVRAAVVASVPAPRVISGPAIAANQPIMFRQA